MQFSLRTGQCKVDLVICETLGLCGHTRTSTWFFFNLKQANGCPPILVQRDRWHHFVWLCGPCQSNENPSNGPLIWWVEIEVKVIQDKKWPADHVSLGTCLDVHLCSTLYTFSMYFSSCYCLVCTGRHVSRAENPTEVLLKSTMLCCTARGWMIRSTSSQIIATHEWTILVVLLGRFGYMHLKFLCPKEVRNFK